MSRRTSARFNVGQGAAIRGFICELADFDSNVTFYQRQYPDRFAPEVLFLVPRPERADSINRALTEWAVQRRRQWKLPRGPDNSRRDPGGAHYPGSVVFRAWTSPRDGALGRFGRPARDQVALLLFRRCDDYSEKAPCRSTSYKLHSTTVSGHNGRDEKALGAALEKRKRGHLIDQAARPVARTPFRSWLLGPMPLTRGFQELSKQSRDGRSPAK